jgi:hypothetical protein
MYELNSTELDAVCGGHPGHPHQVAGALGGLAAIAANLDLTVKDVIDIGDVTVGDVASGNNIPVAVAILGIAGART